MVGKATLFIVAGFSLIFLIVEYNMGNTSTRAVENFVDYYLESYAHELAVSGAEMAANKIYLNQTWTEGYKDLDFKGGKINVNVEVLDAFQNKRKITSVGEYQSVKQTVEVILAGSKFSKYAYYSVSEGGNIVWMDKDTVWGPLHSQDRLKISGSPVFYGKVTTLKGLNKGTYDKPQFLGGYQSGVDVPIPTSSISSMKNIAETGGFKISGKSVVYITFAGDQVKIKYSSYGTETIYDAKKISGNGVIFVENAEVHLQGTVKGQFTVVASGSTKGKFYLDNDIVYNTDPLKNPSSTDILGIVAENDVIITDNTANNNDINIHASIFCQKGSFEAENYSRRPVSGEINLVGGIIQYVRGPVGTISGTSIKTGFSKRYLYDDRLMLMYPPGFPGTGGYEIVSWYE